MNIFLPQSQSEAKPKDEPTAQRIREKLYRKLDEALDSPGHGQLVRLEVLVRIATAIQEYDRIGRQIAMMDTDTE